MLHLSLNRFVCIIQTHINTLLVSIFILICLPIFSQGYKEKMKDHSVNFYSVVQAAETYFEVHGKGKGSGWKDFQRWVNDNEYKYYPSGDRSVTDPYFTENSFNFFKQNNNTNKALFPTGWEELGPTSPGQITGHYAFGMGRILSFYVDPNNTDRLYLGSRTGGFWSSFNGGLTWNGGSTDFLPACGVNSMDASPTNPDSILININNSNNHYSHGIYRSIDGGASWVQTNFNPTNLGMGGLGSSFKVFVVRYHPTIPNLVFVGTNAGLFRSDDNLNTWTQLVTNNDITQIEFHPTNPNITYIYDDNYWGANQNFIQYSTDIGLTFSPSSTLTGNNNATCRIRTSTSCPNCVYVASGNGLWKSTDSGVNFTFISDPAPASSGFAVSDLNDNNILMGYVDAEMSTDGGLTFNQVTYWSLGNTNGAGSGHQVSYNSSTNYIHADLQNARSVNGIFYAVTDGFLVRSLDNGINWEILSEDIGIRMNYNLGVSQSNHERSICGSQDNGTSIITEAGWVEAYGADGMECLIHPLNDDWMIGSWQNGGRVITKDAGQTQSTITPNGETGHWVAPMVYDPNEQMSIYSFATNVHRSDDWGATWTNVGAPSFGNTIMYASIAENNTNILVATRNEFIELSTDAGASWSSIKGSLPNYSITDVVFDPNDDNTIIVTYGRWQNDNSKVFITHDQGVTWSNITYNLGNIPVRSVVIDHTNASTIYLGTEIGIYKKSMSGVSWSLYNPSLPNTTIKEMEIMWGSNTLRATTWGRGLWEYTLDGRLNYPAILTTDITDTPTLDTPKENVDQYVSSTIDYDNTLTNVWVEWSINNPTFGNVIPMSNSTGNEWVSNTPIPNQPVGTKVFFKVFALGTSNDTTETYKFHYTIKPFEYCAASGSNDGSNYRLTNVTIVGVNNTTGNDTYTYYPNEVVELEIGNTYSISLTASTSWGNNDFAAWIDFDDDAIFETGEEILFVQNAGSSNAIANFTVPTDAKLNDTVRLRTRVSYWGTPDPCGTTLGEVEDYPVYITNGTALPIELISFNGKLNDNVVDLSWITASEINNDYFTIERLNSANSWEELIHVEGAGNSTDVLYYEATDLNPREGRGYYRLKQTDFSGIAKYSNTINVNLIDDTYKIYPNPTNKFLNIVGEDIENSIIEIRNNIGQLCLYESLNSENNSRLIDLSELAEGIYFLKIKHEDSMEIIKVIVEH